MRSLLLIAGLAGILSAQSGFVQNAATYQPPFLTATFLLVSSPSNGVNTISPGMLAVLIYPSAAFSFTFNAFSLIAPEHVNATLYIRPVGTLNRYPVKVEKATPGLITFVVPRGLPPGGAELLYKIDNQPTQWTPVEIVASSFVLIRNSTGLTSPAKPGDTVLLSGSGLGIGTVTSATVGGVPAPVTRAGPHRKQPGIDEIAIQIPAAAPDGCYVPVTITFPQTTLTSTISKSSDGSPCRHPFQLSVSDMKTLDSGGTVATGLINLSTDLNEATSSESSRNQPATFIVTQSTAGAIADFFAPSRTASAPGCDIAAIGIPTFAFRTGDFLPGSPALPDIGAASTVQNPGGGWTWHSNGGKDLPPSSFNFSVPDPIRINGGVPLPLRRDRDQTITWNGAAYDSGATVSLLLSANPAIVACAAPASAGGLTIPAALLSRFPANSIGTLNLTLRESAQAEPHTQFKLNNGNTLLIVVDYTSSDTRPVDFQ